MPNVFISPQYDTPDRAEGGIRRVIEAMVRYLPDYGWQVVNDARVADILNGHGVMRPTKQGAPFVGSCHGLHWADYEWANWAHEVNGMVTDNLRRSQATTAPSHWVAQAMRRGMLINPTVVYHGVNPAEWAHKLPPKNYVLWNKGRADPVSNPADMNAIAARMPLTRFVSTVGRATDNVSLCGVLPLPELKPIIQSAGVYLATARETFGVGTLESLAAGVPVVGWNYGGQSEIVIQGETGYLAEPGNYAELERCIHRAFSERARLSSNAIDDVKSRWLWPDKIAQYAAVFDRVWVAHTTPRPKVSIIVTCHNLGHYLNECLTSVARQPFKDFECLIIDDCSTDDTRVIGETWAAQDSRFIYHKTPRNLKLVGALNFGFGLSTGRYTMNLDADNRLGDNALALLADALDNDPTLSIAYGKLITVNHEGQESKLQGWPNGFDWYLQMAHVNQIHSSAMMRREVREMSGGYRERMWRAEDAEFWCRVTSFGFKAAMVTEYPTLIYRMRSDSKSRGENGDGDWCGWFPWRISNNAQDGYAMVQANHKIRNEHLVPFSAVGEPPRGWYSWRVYHHQAPLVSVVIPVGPGHREHVINALDSLIAQDVNTWEAIVVNDTGDDWSDIPGAWWATVVKTKGKQGPAAARNLGIRAARGKLILFCDADDYLRPGVLKEWIREYTVASENNEASYIYTDYIEAHNDRTEKLVSLPEYIQTEWRGQHAVNILIAKQDLLDAGLFDEKLRGWEDWDLFVRLAVSGKCGKRISWPGFAYNFETGTIRETSFNNGKDILPVLKARYADFFNGIKPMSKCCGGNADALIAAKATIAALSNLQSPYTTIDDPLPTTPRVSKSGITARNQRMEFIGEHRGGATYFGNHGREYVGGDNPLDKYADVHGDDVARLEASGVWRRIQVSEPEPVQDVIETIPELIMDTTPQEPMGIIELFARVDALLSTPDLDAPMSDVSKSGVTTTTHAAAVEIAPVVSEKKRGKSKSKK